MDSSLTRSALLVALATAASASGCLATDRGDPRPGGSGTSGTENPDPATPADGGSSQFLAGTLCGLIDPAVPTACGAASVPGVSVSTLGIPGSTLSTSDGSFSFSASTGLSGFVAAQGANNRRPSRISALDFARLGNVLPTMSQDDYDQLTIGLGVIEPDDSASIALYVVREGIPEPGVEVTEPPGTLSVFYDDAVAGWDSLGETENAGAILLFAVPVEAGVASLAVTTADAQLTNVNVPVTRNTTTFAIVELAPNAN